MKTLHTALLALSFTTLSAVVGCSAPTDATSSDVGPAPVVTKTKRHTVVVGEDHEIVARRESLRVKKAFGVKALGSETPAGPATFVRSSGTVVANPRVDGALTIALARGVGGAPAAVAAGGVVSSDPSVATATVSGAELSVSLTGKLGNTYLTTFDAAGNATAKVMILSAVAQPGTAIVDDEALEPEALQVGDYGVPEQLATDFGARTNDQALAALYAATPGSNQRVGAMTFASQDAYRAFAKAAIDAVGMGPSGVRAIYFPKKDLLVTTVHGDMTGTGTPGGSYEVSIGAAVSQADFASYVDFGGVLTSSPLHDANAVETGALSFTSGGASLGATAPVTLGVVLADGRRVMASEAAFGEAQKKAVRHIVAYPQPGEPLGEALTCETSKSAGAIDWSALYSTAETKLVADAKWNGGKPSIALDLTPQVRVGGQIGFAGSFEGTCEKTMFEVPVAEWGIPLFGNVAVNAPVKVEFKVKADGSVTVMTPRVELGSAADTSKPGKIGFSYAVGGKFTVDRDLAMKTSYTSLGAVEGSAQGNAHVEVEAGIAAALGLEAQVKAWIFKASVRADLGDVTFGVKDEADLTVYPASMTYDASNTFELGLFPRLAPTLHVDTSFFHKSFNLFSVDLGDISFYDERSTPKGQKLFSKETVTQTKTQDGTPVAYVQASDHIEIRDMGDIASVESVVTSIMGGEYRRFVDPQITAGISGARINMTGIDTNKLARAYQANGQGTLLGESDLDVHMTNGKTVRVFLGTGM
ncbi:MAG: hypothetical protein IPK71_36495 [Myxococcales bacterium]|nr:hypothetical protein [Myxococcales bacterium]